MEFFEFDNFLVLRCLDTFKGCKLVIRLLVKLYLDALDESVQLLDPVLLSFLDFFD